MTAPTGDWTTGDVYTPGFTDGWPDPEPPCCYPHWCVTPGCQHMPAMGHDYCRCCEDRGTKP